MDNAPLVVSAADLQPTSTYLALYPLSHWRTVEEPGEFNDMDSQPSSSSLAFQGYQPTNSYQNPNQSHSTPMSHKQVELHSLDLRQQSTSPLPQFQQYQSPSHQSQLLGEAVQPQSYERMYQYQSSPSYNNAPPNTDAGQFIANQPQPISLPFVFLPCMSVLLYGCPTHSYFACGAEGADVWDRMSQHQSRQELITTVSAAGVQAAHGSIQKFNSLLGNTNISQFLEGLLHRDEEVIKELPALPYKLALFVEDGTGNIFDQLLPGYVLLTSHRLVLLSVSPSESYKYVFLLCLHAYQRKVTAKKDKRVQDSCLQTGFSLLLSPTTGSFLKWFSNQPLETSYNERSLTELSGMRRFERRDD
eukprot:gene4013-6460_t